VLTVPCDVTQPDSVEDLVETVCSTWGGLDIAVCNAGVVSLNGLEAMTLEEFEAVQKTNVSGVFLTAQACARLMIRQKRPGSIIMTASMSGHVINVPQTIGHYCASKAAVIQLAKAMAVEFAPHGIRVNSVSPGYVMTELVRAADDLSRGVEAAHSHGAARPAEEMMGLYVYLASDASSYMTGSDIVIDGGIPACDSCRGARGELVRAHPARVTQYECV
jgi:NAD(P)-dependent dehydrogenase (short-subunit alcohol dehydrogenase family)